MSASSWWDQSSRRLHSIFWYQFLSVSLIVNWIDRENSQFLRETQLPSLIILPPIYLIFTIIFFREWPLQIIESRPLVKSYTLGFKLRICSYLINCWRELKSGITGNLTLDQIFLLVLAPNLEHTCSHFRSKLM